MALATALFGVGCTHSHRMADAGSGGEEPTPAPGADRAEESRVAGASLWEHLGGGMSALLGDAAEEETAPYEEPGRSADFEEGEDHFAVVELSGPIVELRSRSLFGPTGVELRGLVEKFDDLAQSDEVEGVLLRLGEPLMALSAAEELRGALAAFRERSGDRPVFCHAQRASVITYYLLSACDEIGLAPLGEVSIPGVAATPIYIRGLLDKIGVRPQFLQVGDHKGAGEPLTRERPSPEQEQTLDRVLDTRFRTLVRGIAKGREISTRRVRQLIDRAIFDASAARRARLVDEVATFSDYRDAALGGAPWRRESFTEEPPAAADMDGLMEWLGLSPPSRPRGERVAVVHMVGPIVEGDGRGRAGLREEIASRRATSALGVLAEDDAVSSVVVRIDSPGGSAQASEQVWIALSELANEKPVVVSMGPVAASGGYYVASPADKIYALDTTLTGSIGVAGGKLVLDEGLDKLGIRAHPQARGERALLGSPVVEWNEDEKELVRSLMRQVYGRFVGRVAEGRGLSREEVQSFAGGRLWTGRDALERGLIDEIGGLDDALATARELGGVSAEAPLEVYPPEPSVLDVLSGGGGVSARPAGGGAPSEILAKAQSALGGADFDLPEVEAAFELVSLALALYEAPVTTISFSAAALRQRP